jgi:hypothetical protein
MPRSSLILGGLLISFAIASRADADEPARLEFTRVVAHWAEYGNPDYLKFIEEAQPDIAQVGFYGAHFWSLAHTAQYNGYPANFPVRGLNELGAWFEDLNAKLHARGVKVVGHFNVEFLVGDPESPEGPRGFFKFYRELWDEKTLGPKPTADPVSLLEKDASGVPIKSSTYSIGGMNEYWACLRNPAWQQVLKAWLRQGIRRGLDGVIINYFYRHNCLCEHCQAAFRHYLQERFSRIELRNKLGINDLASHRFAEIVSWHPAAETTPLRLEMLRFSQISNKAVFDDVFIRYGRSLKPDLIVAQWNHLGDFSQLDGDERCLLPKELWGRDESYLWYSTGAQAYFTDFKNRFLGEGTLQARYIRGAFDDRPFTLGKYESTRIRAAIAELAANGGAPMGFYTTFTDPLARREIVRYYQFLKRFDPIYRGNLPHAEVALIFPRSQVHEGNIAAVETFRNLGRALLDAHVLFDVWPDDQLAVERGVRYKKVVSVADSTERILTVLTADISRFRCPYTVRVSASRPAANDNELDLHFVNYDRTELPPGADGKPNPGTGIADEKPLAVSGMTADVVLPRGKTVRSARFLTPEKTEVQKLAVQIRDGRVRFEVPEFLVYAVIQLELGDAR